MITVKITADTGLTWVTSVSCSFDEAKAYFSNAIFVNETDDGVETRHKCISIESIPNILPRPQQHEIDAKIQQALEAIMRHKYTTPAVIGLSTTVSGDMSLGFHFDTGRSIGDVFRFDDGTMFEVLALV